MNNQKIFAIVCAVLLTILMIASDYSAYTTEMAIAEAKGEVFEKSFSPMWGSFIIPLLIICLLYTSPSPRDRTRSRMPSSA